MKINYGWRLILIALCLVLVAGGGLLGKQMLTPKSFGIYGYYRADAIEEVAKIPIRHATNASCFSCHAHEAASHLKGRHKTISCEFCHSTYADHIKDGKKVAALPVKKKEEITTLCLRCHNRAVMARPKDIIQTVVMPDHLKEQKVKLTHTCNQCHYVHAPLKYINRAKQITGFTEGKS